MSIYTDPAKRHDFVYLFDVSNGNPNGDPDAGNLPRIDPETMHGLVTDVALKRKVRDYIQVVHQKSIFIQSQEALNTLILGAFKDAGGEPPEVESADEDVIQWIKENEPENLQILGENKVIYTGEKNKQKDILNELVEGRDLSNDMKKKLTELSRNIAQAAKGKKRITKEIQGKAQTAMLQGYYDIRMFGAVLSTGLNAGQVRGPMQLTFGRSLDPILPLDLTITRQARTTEERMETGSTEMGRKPIIPYGLYTAKGFFNPYLAEKTGVTSNDLELFWEALTNMFELDRSAARGEMACRGLYIFTHENKKGNTHAHRLFAHVKVNKKDSVEVPRSFEDYQIVVDEDLPQGVTLTKL